MDIRIKQGILPLLGAVCLSFHAYGQNDGSFALPVNLNEQVGKPLIGYPVPMADHALKKAFRTPPRGYGNVPFYWWTGDRLTKERLSYQLNLLKDAHTEGFAVSYSHTHPQVDKASDEGFGGFGRTDAGTPPVFSPEWQEIWNWFSEECAKHGIGAGLDDYTFAWPGNGYYPDVVKNLPGIRDYQGELTFRIDTISPGGKYVREWPENTISCVAWGPNGTSVDLTSFRKGEKVEWTAPQGETPWHIYLVHTSKNYMLHPEYGNEIVGHYFQAIENSMNERQREGMNFFFQDELHIPFGITTWSEDMAEAFLNRKGYDVRPYLGALKGDIGRMTDKVRLDYCEVLMDLAEERYFKPIFDWNWDRGLIYGCDNLGRGLEPASYLDYFRATRWFTAPGNDAPARGSSLTQCKVSSSIAHLYQRPRTWLEAFHSMGWGSDGEILTAQFDHHAIGGGNLLCLHGLYYSTRGGWWEWAPPDFHFRMPYWPHMKYWLGYAERMSFILSQGKHQCDVAIIYPTETSQILQPIPPRSAFTLGRTLFDRGIDFDFIDYQSLRRATTENGALHVSDESYRILILADMAAMHHSSLEKAVEHFRSGGIVVASGRLPETTTLNGSDDPTVNRLVKELFGVTAAEQKQGIRPTGQSHVSGGKTIYTDEQNIYADLTAVHLPDFRAGNGKGKVMHRRIGERDLYMVMNVRPDTELFFRTHGGVEVWDAFSGETVPQPILRQDGSGTYIRSEADSVRSVLYVFTPSEQPLTANSDSRKREKTLQKRVATEGEWEISYLPTMDNRFGDYRLPALKNEIIGPEARTFAYMDAATAPAGWQSAKFDYSTWPSQIYGYGLQAFRAYADTTVTFEQFNKQVQNGSIDWEPYEFSWQFGVWDNPGSQGYHGLKGKVDDGFFLMEKPGHYVFRTAVYVPESGMYRIEKHATLPTVLRIDGKETVENTIRLAKGWHSIQALYQDVKAGFYSFDHSAVDERPRSAIVLIPSSSPSPKPHDEYTEALSMRWLDAGERLLFDPNAGKVKRYAYLFDAAPGLESIELDLHGEISNVWIDGHKVKKGNIRKTASDSGKDGNSYTISLPTKMTYTPRIALEVEPQAGYAGSGVFARAVKLNCGTGRMEACDWSTQGALRHYSGGMWYRKNVSLSKPQAGEQVVLDLGEVVATCEVHVNGQKAGILLNKPFRADVTDLITEGENRIEVLVYSTLSNHYQTIPTPKHYRGNARAGLIGPVSVEYLRESK